MESATSYHKPTRLYTYQGSFGAYKHFKNARFEQYESWDMCLCENYKCSCTLHILVPHLLD